MSDMCPYFMFLCMSLIYVPNYVLNLHSYVCPEFASMFLIYVPTFISLRISSILLLCI